MLILLKKKSASAPVLLTNLVAGYRLEEATGTRYDVSPNGYNLTAINSPSNAAGIQGQGLEFISNSQALERAWNTALAGGHKDWSYSVWFKAANFSAYIGLIGADEHHTGNRDHFGLIDLSGKGVLFVQGTSGDATPVTANSASAGAWNHFSAWYKASNREVGVCINNGTPATVTLGSDALADTATKFSVGNRYTGLGYDLGWVGFLDEVYRWNDLSGKDHRAWLHNGGAGRSWAEMQAYMG